MWMETWEETAGSVAHGWGAGHRPGNYYFFHRKPYSTILVRVVLGCK